MPLWVGLFALLLSVASVAFGDVPSGVFENGMCWDKEKIPLTFDPALAPDLENPGNNNPPLPSAGDTRARRQAFIAAVDAWNRALGDVGSKKRLVLVARPPRPWAADQAVEECGDNDARHPVFAATYARTSPDQHNAASTAWASRSKVPGWVVGKGDIESYSVCQRLAETKLVPPPTDKTAQFIAEADVLYFTHLREGRGVCKAISWDYRNVAAPAAPYYDFYSVMLHEVGHVLGLDHQDCGENGPGKRWIPNVMAARLMAGDRGAILACEMVALGKLYGVNGRCADKP